ncbi:MAG: SWIM zinc finger family protein [Chitinivibrionales bacterium]|nr:SWIM zinc finger family protein [Chitinivibrionales bacterium]
MKNSGSKEKRGASTHTKNLTTLQSLAPAYVKEQFGSALFSRGKSYQANRQVEELCQTEAGGLVAWVEDTHTYATTVSVAGGTLKSQCTCPCGGSCKHVVAVILEWFEQTKAKKEIPKALSQDERLTLIEKQIWFDDDRDEDSPDEDLQDDDFEGDDEHENGDSKGRPKLFAPRE